MVNFDRMNECARILEKDKNPLIMTELLCMCSAYANMILSKNWSFTKEDSEDIKQELSLKIVKIFERGQFRSGSKSLFSFYFHRMLKNYLASIYKKSISTYMLDVPIEKLMELPSKDNVEHEIDVKTRVEKLKKKIVRNQKELKTIELYEIGYSMPEIDALFHQKRGSAHFRMTALAKRAKNKHSLLR